MMAPTSDAAIAILSEVKKYGIDAGNRSFQKVWPALACQVRIWSSCIWSGLRSPFTMPTTTGKNDRYMLIIAFGSSPDTPTAFRTTMIIGAIARMGMVWLAITQGITDISITRLNTIPTASKTPSKVPMPKPSRVALSVIQE